MAKEIYSFSEYRTYLEDRISRKAGAPRGMPTAMANAIPCQISYLSRVMSGEADLSLEQADAVNRFFGHSKEEAHYFFLLVQHARAGTKTLKTYFQDALDQVHRDRLLLQKRVGVEQSLSRENQAKYYSVWYYAAIHVLTGIPEFQTKDAMARLLNLPVKKVSETLSFLSTVGLAESLADGRYKTGLGRIHLERDSPMLPKHHANWRIQAIRAIEIEFEENLHYSVVLTISKSDAQRLREMVADFVEKFMKVVHPSKDEELLAFNIDLFRPTS